MTYGTDRTYGKMGANPCRPTCRARRRVLKQNITGHLHVLEGIYDDINSAAVAPIARHPTGFSPKVPGRVLPLALRHGRGAVP